MICQKIIWALCLDHFFPHCSTDSTSFQFLFVLWFLNFHFVILCSLQDTTQLTSSYFINLYFLLNSFRVFFFFFPNIVHEVPFHLWRSRTLMSFPFHMIYKNHDVLYSTWKKFYMLWLSLWVIWPQLTSVSLLTTTNWLFFFFPNHVILQIKFRKK